MLKLTVQQLIVLKYVTKYNIKLMQELYASHQNWDTMLNGLIHEFRISEKDIYSSFEESKIAMDKLDYYGITAIPFYDERYPLKLRKIPDGPPILYVKGDLQSKRLAAVVGSRRMSPYGAKITRHVVDWLDDLDYGVVSGLALGIDTVAHQESISNNQYTIAVMPNALDTIYPNENYALANNILNAGGALVSEMVFGLNRGKKTFVQRNRIQAALSDAVIPIEMGISSGTTHTVNYGYRYNKKVLVMAPTKTLETFESYGGIIELIRNRRDGLMVFRDESSFKEQMLGLNDSEPNLFGY